MKHRFALINVMVLALILTLLCQAVTYSREGIGAIDEEKGISLESIDELFSMVKGEFVGDAKIGDLVNGALLEIKEYQKKQKLDSSFIREVPATLSAEDQIKKFNEMYGTLLTTYPKISKEQLSYAAIRGMMKSLKDPYTVFMDPREYKNLMEQMKGGSFGGIGIYIELDKENGNQLTVVDAIEGTPGYKAGLKAGDAILKVDGKSTKGMSINDAQRVLRGETGSKVTLTISRPPEKEPFDLDVIRDIIQVKSLTYRMLEGDMGYIKLMIFGENTDDEIRNALESLDEKGARGYILDLRNNGGGYVNAAISVCSEFLPTASTVVTIVKKGSTETPYKSAPNLRSRKPLVNIVNKYSASASEITAGALQDNHAAVILGTKTFGKASVQKIYPLPNGSAIKITTAKYLTPEGKDIHKRGITPDVVLDLKEGKVDNQLEAAKKILLGEITKQEEKDAKNLAFKDAIKVRTLQEQYAYLQKTYGDNVVIDKDELIYESGRLYDRVTIRGSAGVAPRVLYFEVESL